MVLGSEIASGAGMLLIIDGAAEKGGLATQSAAPLDNWREAHTNGAQKVRTLGPVVLPTLLLIAGVLSFISPEVKESGEEFWEDDFSF